MEDILIKRAISSLNKIQMELGFSSPSIVNVPANSNEFQYTIEARTLVSTAGIFGKAIDQGFFGNAIPFLCLVSIPSMSQARVRLTTAI